MGPKIAALAVVMMLLIVAFPLPEAVTGQTTPQSNLIVDEFEDDLAEHDLAFPGPGFNDQTALVLPNHAFVDTATINMSFGTFPGSRSAPWDPSLDIGDDGSIDWAFDSDKGGPLGLQDRFSDGARDIDLQFNRGGTRQFYVQLPREATITEAYIDVEGFPIPHWVQQYTLTPKTDSPGEYGPKMTEYNGEMWVIWESSDQNITTGGDADIVVRMFDGERWYRIIELSEAGDTDEDKIPHIIAYGDKLYAIWSKGDGKATDPGNSELVYCEYDGTDWSDPVRFSGPKENGLNTYERCTVFKDRLYVAWKSTDPSYTTRPAFGDDLDIVIASFDGTTWSQPQEITDSNNDATDWSVDITVFRDRLYVIWDTWDPNIAGHGNVDVVYRAYDGTTWTGVKNLSPASDKSIAYGGVQDALPRFYVWDNPVTGEEELYAIWMRGQTILSNGDGYHIVYRRYTASYWTAIEQLSFPSSGDPVDQMFPALVSFNQTLYAIWTIGTNTTSRPEGGSNLIATYGDIIIRSFDGATWSPILELTPLGNGYDNASHPSIFIYGGNVYAAWETPLPTAHDTLSWEIVMRHLEISPVTVKLEFGEGEPVVWGWERLSNTKSRVYFDPEGLTRCLNSSPFTVDGYGNRYTEMPITLENEAAAKVRLSNLTIRYDYEVTVDFAEEAETTVARLRDNTHVDKDVRIVFKVSTGQAGRISLEDPKVVYKLDYPPMLLSPVPDQQVYEDEARDYLVNLAEYFIDDWDTDNLRCTIVEESDPTKVDAYLIDSWLSVKLPEKDWTGEIEVKVRAFDRHPFYHNDSNEFIIKVLPINDAPILGFIPDKELEVDVEHYYVINATDPDPEDKGLLEFASDSDIVEVDKNGHLKVTFRTLDPRVIFFNVTVTDPQGASDTQEVRFNYTVAQVRIQDQDEFPWALLLLLILVLGLVVAERMRRPYRMTDEEAMWNEEAAYEEQEEARLTGQWWRRFF
jgi:hypothetical protein